MRLTPQLIAKSDVGGLFCLGDPELLT
jgi:hypothetical protein